MSKGNSKANTKRLERKAYRRAEKAVLGGASPRSLRTTKYNTPHSLRRDTLPLPLAEEVTENVS